jgi:hypothetical protein
VTEASNQDEKDKNIWKFEDHNKQAILIPDHAANKEQRQVYYGYVLFPSWMRTCPL